MEPMATRDEIIHDIARRVHLAMRDISAGPVYERPFTEDLTHADRLESVIKTALEPYTVTRRTNPTGKPYGKRR